MPDARYGCENMVAKLERVLVRRPEEAACERWLDYGWRSAPDFGKLLHEHDAFCALLECAGAEIVFGGAVPLGLDAIYAFDYGRYGAGDTARPSPSVPASTQ